jgi:hypothetical protein
MGWNYKWLTETDNRNAKICLQLEAGTSGLDKAELAGRVGALAGIVTAQERWLYDEGECAITRAEAGPPAVRWAL